MEEPEEYIFDVPRRTVKETEIKMDKEQTKVTIVVGENIKADLPNLLQAFQFYLTSPKMSTVKTVHVIIENDVYIFDK